MTTKTDLEAANREIRSVMDQNMILRKERDEAYQNGYRGDFEITELGITALGQ